MRWMLITWTEADPKVWSHFRPSQPRRSKAVAQITGLTLVPSGTQLAPRSGNLLRCVRDEQPVIPFPNHPCTLSASLAVRLYCRRFAFAFTNDVEMELASYARNQRKC